MLIMFSRLLALFQRIYQKVVKDISMVWEELNLSEISGMQESAKRSKP